MPAETFTPLITSNDPLRAGGPQLVPQQFQNWNQYTQAFENRRREAEFLRAMVQGDRRIQDTMQKIDTAMRFLEMRNLQKDIEANPNLSIADAILRHPKAVGFSELQRAQQAKQLQQQQQRVGTEVPLAGGRSAVWAGPQRLQVIPESRSAQQSTPAQIHAQKLGELRAVNSRLAALERTAAMNPKKVSDPLIDTLRRKSTAIMLELQGAGPSQVQPQTQSAQPGTAPATGGVITLRRKSDGSMFRYRGAPEDVPTDQYEVIGNQ